MTADLAILAAEPDLATLGADPAVYVITACERAKGWLATALDSAHIEDIVEVKSQAEAIRVYTLQKQLGKDAELSATEIVRRAERCIGQAIRKGQEAGEIRKADDFQQPGVNARDLVDVTNKVSPAHVAGVDRSTVSEFYAVADDVTDEYFDSVIEEAKAEHNLSRANVVRKVTGKPFKSKSKRPEILRRTRHLDAHRVVNEIAIGLDGYCHVIALLEDEHFASLDHADLEAWSSSLRKSLREIGALTKRLEKELNQRD